MPCPETAPSLYGKIRCLICYVTNLLGCLSLGNLYEATSSISPGQLRHRLSHPHGGKLDKRVEYISFVLRRLRDRAYNLSNLFSSRISSVIRQWKNKLTMLPTAGSACSRQQGATATFQRKLGCRLLFPWSFLLRSASGTYDFRIRSSSPLGRMMTQDGWSV